VTVMRPVESWAPHPDNVSAAARPTTSTVAERRITGQAYDADLAGMTRLLGPGVL
jgi:hypothetical protein